MNPAPFLSPLAAAIATAWAIPAIAQLSPPTGVGFATDAEYASADSLPAPSDAQLCSAEECAGPACEKKKEEAKKKPAPTKPDPCLESHKGVFYANDFSYLKDPKYCGNCLGDRMKLMPVGPSGNWGTLDVGGQYRLRFHDEEGMGRSRSIAGADGFRDTENTYLLSRLRLYGNWKVTDGVRVFVEGIHADETGNADYDPRAIDTNYGDLLNAFVDTKLTDELTFRVGRQELLFGAERLVSPLDWANTRRTFEGFRGTYKKEDWVVDGFYTNLVPVQDNEFDEADYDRSFYGLYSVYSGFEAATVDLYYLGFDNETVGTPVQTDFSLHTVGGRLNGKAADKWLYELEGAYQGGRQSGLGLDHNAGFVTAGVGRALKGEWKPTLWVYCDYASGNDAIGDFERFNQLFPLGHKYFGFIDAIARENLISPNVLLSMSPQEKWKLLLWYYYFGAVEAEDTNAGIAVPSVQNDQYDYGQELDLIARYQLSKRSNVLFGYSHFWRGDKIVGTSDADFFYGQWELNF